MFKSFTNKFIPEEKESSKFYRSKVGTFQGWVSASINTILFFAKLAIGLISGSVSLIADAIHTLSDIVTSLIVVWGFKRSSKPADARHPFGHGRSEYIATLIISVFLCVAGIEFIQTAIHRIQEPSLVDSNWLMVTILLFTIIIKEITARYAKFLSNKIASGLLHADAWHHRIDAISSVLVIIALIAGKFGYPAADGWAGLGISLILIYTGLDIAKDSIDDLIGKPPKENELETIRQIVLNVPNALGVHDIVVHSYGINNFISVHVEIDASKTAAEAHDISEEVEQKLREVIDSDPTVHLDPVNPNDPIGKEVNIFLLELIKKENQIISFHDVRAVSTKNHNLILFGVNVKLGVGNSQIVELNRRLVELLKEKFSKYDINIKISPVYKN